MARTISKQGLLDLRKSLLQRLRAGDNACDLYDEAKATRNELVKDLELVLSRCAAEQRTELHRSEAKRFHEIRSDLATFDPLLEELQEAALRQEGRHPEQLEAVKRAYEADADTPAAREWRANHPEGQNVTTTRLTVRSEPTTYSPDRKDAGYVSDLIKRQLFGDSDAAARLQRHAAEMRELNGTESRASGRDTAGDFDPPTWLVSQFVNYARPKRVTADLTKIQAMPPGQQSIVIPRFTQATIVGAQTADNATLASQDIITDHITLPVVTEGGSLTVSQQMLDMTPVALDQILFADLIAAHAQAIGTAVLTGSGTSGQMTGILTSTATNTVTYTSTSPTAAGLYAKIGKAAQDVVTNVYDAPTAVLMHPRRFLWLATQVDSQGRPLITPTADGNQSVNSFSTTEQPTLAGRVGSIMGMDVYTDPNIPTNKGASTNEDVIIVGKFDEASLFETGPKAQVFYEPGAAQMSVLLRVFSYCAFSGALRRPKAFSVIGGTGLSAVLS